MPFTFSHPAIVLPFDKLKRKPFSLTGLIAGSIVPDVEFLIFLRNTENFGHTWLGIIVFDIPVALLLSFVFHLLIRNTLVQYLPKFFRVRLSGSTVFNWINYFKENKRKVFISVAIGILSHVLSDEFTHGDGVFVKMYSFLSSEIAIWKFTFPVYFILQLMGSLLGGLYILWVIFKMPKGNELPLSKGSIFYWLSMILLAAAIFGIHYLLDTTHKSFDDSIIGVTGSFLYALVIVSIIFSKRANTAIKKSPEI
ncbi:DUF4184 family protein [Ferruginibacter sp. SUN106]|uniref:DUF4184 family protein n=1 Tax=Ferruginibacter sp. SUN106 TaxID=2978348 RepID=UPI003D36D20F